MTGELAGDAPFTYAATDGITAPVNKKAVVAKGVGNGFVLTLAADGTAQKVRVYAGVWCAGATVSCRVDGVVLYEGVLQMTSGTMYQCFEIDYIAAAGDEVTITLELTDSYNAQWGGSLLLAAATVQPTDDIAAIDPGAQGKHVLLSAGTAVSAVNVTQTGPVDWAVFNAAAAETKRGGSSLDSLRVTGSKQPGPRGSGTTFLWSDGARQASGEYAQSLLVTGEGNGLSVTLPYSDKAQRVTFYFGAAAARVVLETAVMRGGAVVETATAVHDVPADPDNPFAYGTVALDYQLARPGDTLQVRLTIAEDYLAGGGQGLLGDVNGDSRITVSDVRLTLRAAVGKLDLLPAEAWAADVNGDGRVTVSDVRQILRAAVGKIDLF